MTEQIDRNDFAQACLKACYEATEVLTSRNELGGAASAMRQIRRSDRTVTCILIPRKAMTHEERTTFMNELNEALVPFVDGKVDRMITRVPEWPEP